MPAYTDADVQACKRPILDNFHPPSDRHDSWHIRPEEMARAVLDAVAPAIAARALREAAEAGVSSPTFLRARADSIESGTT